MKKITCLLTAVIMAMTILALPASSSVYAEADVQTIAAQTDVQALTIKGINAKYYYTGAEVKPVPVITYNGQTLKAGTDYTLKYSNNIKVGTAAVTVTGAGSYKGIRTLKYSIIRANVTSITATLSSTKHSYTGKAVKPSAKVIVNGKTLTAGKDYTITYADNVYPGTANAVIEGINYKFRVTRYFTIGKINSLKLTERGTTSLTVAWTPDKYVHGYQIQRYNFTKKKWVTWSTIYNGTASYAKLTGFSEGSTQHFRIRSFVKGSDGNYRLSPWSSTLTTMTKPGKVQLTSLTTNIKMHLKMKWTKKSGSGYQIYVAGDSKFTNPSVFYVKSASAGSTGIQAKTDKKTYYVKMRAYKTVNGTTVYGAWSNVKKVKTNGTGWIGSKGKYYYFNKGVMYEGAHTIDGNPYYFEKGTGVLMGTSSTMYHYVKNKKSKTKYLVSVDTVRNRTVIFTKSDGKWAAKYYIKCSTGAPTETSPISRTPSGTFVVPEKRTHSKYFGDSDGYRCWYTTRVVGGILFHSVLYEPYGSDKLQDGRLGMNLSHGCIRLDKKDAYWMYNNIDAGTTVVILPKR